MPQTDSQQKKIEDVMSEFKAGTLKSSSGKPVTNRDQAIAIALRSAGISSKSLEKAELLNKVRVIKKQIEKRLYKELAKDDSIEKKIVEFFQGEPSIDDSKIHALSEKLNIDTHDFEGKIYSILSSLLYAGKGKGKKVDDFSPEEVEMGRKVEAEHTDNPYLRDKIVVDHLAERGDYYSNGKKKGMFPELAKSRKSKVIKK